jgi:hypothetical protein
MKINVKSGKGEKRGKRYGCEGKELKCKRSIQ